MRKGLGYTKIDLDAKTPKKIFYLNFKQVWHSHTKISAEL